MTAPQQTYPECRVCGHRARHVVTNVRRCDECYGPCLTPEGRAEAGAEEWVDREMDRVAEEREKRNHE